MQSISGCNARWAHLSRDAIKDNNDRVKKLAETLEKKGRMVLSFNTDGIWYKGPVYHGEGEGDGLGEWHNDHVNCKFRAKSSGSYEFIENKKYYLQDKYFNRFPVLYEDNIMTIFNYKLDSLFLLKENMYNFALSYYVRLCSVEDEGCIDGIVEQLPLSYKNIIKTEKVLNSEYYYVNVGPFLSINLAEQALKDLKSIYKSAYIVKKK